MNGMPKRKRKKDEPGGIHYRKFENSEALRKFVAFLLRRPRTGWEIVEEIRTTSPGTIAGELRAQGFIIESRQIRPRVFLYTLKYYPPEHGGSGWLPQPKKAVSVPCTEPDGVIDAPPDAQGARLCRNPNCRAPIPKSNALYSKKDNAVFCKPSCRHEFHTIARKAGKQLALEM